jgi:hypothetical protein
MFGFGRKSKEQLIFEQARAGNCAALQVRQAAVR